jgi:MYXO-CTERM domain-containing protein
MRRLIVVTAALVPALALANGRAPVTNGVFLQPGDPHSLYVRTTFGLLVSHDDACTFRWVCEQSIGYGGEFDPKYAIATDGTLFATTFKGLRVSRDGGCTWTTATDEIWIDALDIGPTGEVWIATAETAAASDVYRSIDNGMTFQHRGMLSPNIWWKSVKVAPSRPQRVYVAGYQVAGQPQAHLLRSDNGGDSWTELPLTGLAFNAVPTILVKAVDPTNPDVLMVSSLGANGDGDRLYRSENGGDTFVEVQATADSIRDVVYHGATVVIAGIAGSYESVDGGKTFQPAAATPHLACLGERNGKLLGCGTNWDPDFMAVAESTDVTTWSKLFRFVDLAGPLSCPAGTPTHDSCEPLWPTLQQQFGATGPTCGLQPDAPPPPPPKTGGCCSSDGAGGTSAGMLAAIVGLALARRRRSVQAG